MLRISPPRYVGRLTLLASAVLVIDLALSSPAFGHGDLHEQIDALTEEIKTAPNDARLYLKRADLRRVHQEIAPAKADYDQAERLDPALNLVHLGRGKLLAGTGAFEEARKELDRFLKAEPNHLDGLVTRARLEVKRKRPLDAAQDYARVIRLPGKAEVEYYLEYAAALSGAGPAHVKDAIEVLDEGIAKIGPIPTLQLQAIELEVARKEYGSALKRLDTLANGAGRKESWLERRGDILLQAGEDEQALQAYQRATSLIDALPARIRARKATADLEGRLKTKIRALKGNA